MAKKSPIMRYRVLDTLLSRRNHHYSLDDLVNEVNEELWGNDEEMYVTRRCIELDLSALGDFPYNAPIKRVWRNIPGRGGRKKYLSYAEPGFSIFSQKLTEDEENLLSEVLNTIGQFDGLDTFEWLDGLKKRLDIKEHRRIIQFDTNPDLIGRNNIGRLFSAISDKMVIKLKYHPSFAPEVKDITVCPYLLKQYNKRWFLIARINNGAIRNFALDRIDDFELMPDMEYIEPNENFEHYFEDIVGVTLHRDRGLEDILFWVSDNSYRYVETKPMHSSQHVVGGYRDAELREAYPSLQGGRFFRLKCIINTELKQLLMSQMDSLVVLEPATLADEMSRSVKTLHELYSNIRD